MTQKLSQSLQEQLKDKKILILGFGREGQSTYHLLRAIFPEKELFIMDKNKVDDTFLSDTKIKLAATYLDKLEGYDVIFKTPGISILEPNLQAYIQNGGKITSQSNEFLCVYANQVIGVTGTKGKSTTSSIIFHILKRNRLASEHRVWVEFVDDTLYLVTHQRPYLHLIS